jgi:hypothetical protein
MCCGCTDVSPIDPPTSPWERFPTDLVGEIPHDPASPETVRELSGLHEVPPVAIALSSATAASLSIFPQP